MKKNQKRGSRATRRDCHQDRWLPNRTFRRLLDFHYSDDWADPEHERTPKAWAKLSHEDLVSPHEDQGRPRLRGQYCAGVEGESNCLGSRAYATLQSSFTIDRNADAQGV